MKSPRAWRSVAGFLLLGGTSASAMFAAASPAHLTVAFTGQALIQHDLRKFQPEKFQRIEPLLRGHDVVFTDLETAIDTSGAKATRDNVFFHAAQPEVLDCLKEWGFNLLALGNNHAGDLGPAGILGAIREVEARQFAHAGTGRNLAVASAASFIETSHGRVALVAMASKIPAGSAATADGPGVNEVKLGADGQLDATDAARVVAAIQAAATKADCVIVYQHDHYWEKDNQQTPGWKKAWARTCIDAGASVFVSHGAPLLHGIEIYRGRPIFYDLGGLVFHTVTAAGYYPATVWESVVAETEWERGKLVALRLRPVVLNESGTAGPTFYQTRGAPEPAQGESAQAILARVEKLSADYGTRFRREDESASVQLSP